MEILSQTTLFFVLRTFFWYTELGDFMKVTIERFDHQGRGIAYLDGKICFIKNALPGEVVTVHITKSQKKIQEGEVDSFIEKSKNRITPTCPYFAVCGGCDLMHISDDNQLQYKQQKVSNILEKYASISSNIIKPIVGDCNNLNYRNKATFQIQNEIGYYAKGSYHLVPISECKIVDDKINSVLEFLKNQNLEGLDQVVIRSSKTLPEVMVVFKGTKKPTIKQYHPLITSCFFEQDLLFGETVIHEQLGDILFTISSASFFQVNTQGAFLLYQLVRSYLSGAKDDCVLDLYCGTGTIGLFISDSVKEVIGVEVNQNAIQDAEVNKKQNHISNTTFFCGDVAKLVSKLPNCNKVIVDPPRAGLDATTIQYLLNQEFETIVYVSCDPITLARDLKLLSEVYTVIEVTPVDLFHQTYHVECVVKLCHK